MSDAGRPPRRTVLTPLVISLIDLTQALRGPRLGQAQRNLCLSSSVRAMNSAVCLHPTGGNWVFDGLLNALHEDRPASAARWALARFHGPPSARQPILLSCTDHDRPLVHLAIRIQHLRLGIHRQTDGRIVGSIQTSSRRPLEARQGPVWLRLVPPPPWPAFPVAL